MTLAKFIDNATPIVCMISATLALIAGETQTAILLAIYMNTAPRLSE